MAFGFVRSATKLLTCGRGISPVHGFHQLTKSSALQIGSDVGFRSLRMDVDDFSGYSGSKPEVYYRF